MLPNFAFGQGISDVYNNYDHQVTAAQECASNPWTSDLTVQECCDLLSICAWALCDLLSLCMAIDIHTATFLCLFLSSNVLTFLCFSFPPQYPIFLQISRARSTILLGLSQGALTLFKSMIALYSFSKHFHFSPPNLTLLQLQHWPLLTCHGSGECFLLLARPSD